MSTSVGIKSRASSPIPNQMDTQPGAERAPNVRFRPGTRRYLSADSAIVEATKRGPATPVDISSSANSNTNRSLSAGDPSPNALRRMNRLSFENIDLLSTPLSSLRSCSEYQKFSIHSDHNFEEEVKPKAKSFLSYMFSFIKSSDSKVKNRVRFRDSKEDQVFLIENLRFNEANLLEGEDYNYRVDPQKSRDTSASCLSLHTTLLSSPSLTSGSATTTCSSSVAASEQRYRKKNIDGNKTKRKRYSTSFLEESAATFEYLFGIGERNRNIPMEIELRNLREPQLLTVYTTNERGGLILSASHTQQEEALGIRRVTSLGSFQRMRSDSSDSLHSAASTFSGSSSSSHRRQHRPPAVLVLHAPSSWGPWYQENAPYYLRTARHLVFQHFRSSDFFYECLRIQPFASGTYLRCMLWAGFCSTVFNIYNVLSWPSSHAGSPMTTSHHRFETFLFCNLLVQAALSAAQLPIRLNVHWQCWETCRVIEVDMAIEQIRQMLQSDMWIANRALGCTIDAITVANLLMSEVYLWCTPTSDPLRDLLVSLCATSLMTFVIRVAVATAFSLSMHNPQVLSDARRRGLSKWDLEAIPAFVFTSLDEVNNESCSICLCNFELGEMLTSLPCDKKHSFHSSCIRQWLERQNSCPLCQKMV